MVVAGQKLSSGLKALVDTGKPDWIQNQVEESERKHDAPRLDPGWFHPSSLGTKCDAKLAMEFLGIVPREDRFPPRTRRIFDNGHARDRDWKVYIERAGISLVTAKADVKRRCPKCDGKDYDGRHICIPELRIRGDFDDHVRNPVTGKTAIFEFKTKNDALWKKLVKPEEDHITQTHPYMAATGEQLCIIGYENKNDQELKWFEIPFDIVRWQAIIDRLQGILNQLSQGYAPQRACEWMPCDFGQTCTQADFPKMVDEYRHSKGLA